MMKKKRITTKMLCTRRYGRSIYILLCFAWLVIIVCCCRFLFFFSSYSFCVIFCSLVTLLCASLSSWSLLSSLSYTFSLVANAHKTNVRTHQTNPKGTNERTHWGFFSRIITTDERVPDARANEIETRQDTNTVEWGEREKKKPRL